MQTYLSAVLNFYSFTFSSCTAVCKSFGHFKCFIHRLIPERLGSDHLKVILQHDHNLRQAARVILALLIRRTRISKTVLPALVCGCWCDVLKSQILKATVDYEDYCS